MKSTTLHDLVRFMDAHPDYERNHDLREQYIEIWMGGAGPQMLEATREFSRATGTCRICHRRWEER